MGDTKRCDGCTAQAAPLLRDAQGNELCKACYREIYGPGDYYLPPAVVPLGVDQDHWTLVTCQVGDAGAVPPVVTYA